MVVLATGDPNFFGIARHLNEAIDREAIAIIPNVSSMQLAFARIKESWDDAVFASVHSRPVESIVDTVALTARFVYLLMAKIAPPRLPGYCGPAASPTAEPIFASTWAATKRRSSVPILITWPAGNSRL